MLSFVTYRREAGNEAIVNKRESESWAQVGGWLAHAVEDYGLVRVFDDKMGEVMCVLEYDELGI